MSLVRLNMQREIELIDFSLTKICNNNSVKRVDPWESYRNQLCPISLDQIPDTIICNSYSAVSPCRPLLLFPVFETVN